MAQLTTTTVDTEVTSITQLVDQVAFGAQVLQSSDPVSSQEELPGLGHKFELFGVMIRDTDPQNPAGNSGASGGGVGGNETISANTTPTTFALAFRNTPPGIKIAAFRNQLGLKYFFPLVPVTTPPTTQRSCGGGSPRITLLVDANGDGQFVGQDVDPTSPDFAVHGHVNVSPHQGCPPGMWMYENLTDNTPRWESTPQTATGCGPAGNPAVECTWVDLQTRVTALYPNHKILAGFLVDDSCSFFPAACGKAYYDLVTIENRTLEIWQDTVQKSQ